MLAARLCPHHGETWSARGRWPGGAKREGPGARLLPETRSGRERLGPTSVAFLATGLLVGSLLSAGSLEGKTSRTKVSSGQSAALVNLQQIFLEATPEKGEGWIQFSRRLTGSESASKELVKLNRAGRRMLVGVRYRVPLALLKPELQVAVLGALFPQDRPTAAGWSHRSRGERLEVAVEWLTGSQSAAEEVRKSAGLGKGSPRAGSTYVVPAALLAPAFRALVVPPAPAAPGVTAAPSAAPGPAAESTPAGNASVVPASDGAPLTYGEDALGKFAIYRLRPGEALYSSVVIRFTGRLHAEDVNALAAEIAARSGIVDVTDIPIGFPVKVPFEVLLPEFLPARDPRRLEYEVEQRLAGQYRNEVRASGLEGVLVILDPGHGGSDVGASMAGVWESLYVYDIALRVQRALASQTRAEARLTTRDGKEWRIVDQDVLPYSRGHAVLTTPPYAIADARIGVHLRWYLANSLYRKAEAKSEDGDRVVFISLHADSLHASLRGATAYIPDTAGTEGSFRKSGEVFSARAEVRERPEVRFSLKERQRSEGLSRELAERIIAEFRQASLDVHPFKPVRDRIYRGRRAWVPAVLRYNAVPAKLLLEVCNLANPADRKLLQTREFRERIAQAVVRGLLAYFGSRSGG